MAAAQFGASLLADVQKESLAELLADLRCVAQPSSQGLLRLHEVDELLQTVRPSPTRLPPPALSIPALRDFHGTGHELHSDDDVQHQASDPLSATSRHQTALIELSSSATSTGKTSLLYLLSAIAILPNEYNGKDSAIVWLDTEAKFSALRLYRICLSCLMKHDPKLPRSRAETIANEALKHVHVFPVQSSKQLHKILDDLPSYLLQNQATETNRIHSIHYSSHRALSMIILDSTQAFHWLDRLDIEMARLEYVGLSTNTTASTTAIILQTVIKLKLLANQFTASVLYTTNHDITQLPLQAHQTSIQNPRLASSAQQQYQPPSNTAALSPWTTNATLSLSFSRISVSQFATHMTLSDCLQDREKRMEAVRKGRVSVRINDAWMERCVKDRDVKERLTTRARTKGMGSLGFVMRISDTGVDIEPQK